MKPITRRDWLQTGALLCGAPCACLAEASNDCCAVPDTITHGVGLGPGLVKIDLDFVRELQRTGAAFKVVDTSRNLQIVVAHAAKNQFVALDQKCTHGGGALTYVHKHQHLYCTCWGHAKFALDGSVLRWPNQQTPRPLRAHRVERKGNLLEIHVEGLA
jgi:nitrite reductase/ring-hydroxylating ferredoxin subunit